MITSCHGFLVFTTFKGFVMQSDNLYPSREKAKYLHWNPMHAETKILVNIRNFLQFPTGYKFEQFIHDIDILARIPLYKLWGDLQQNPRATYTCPCLMSSLELLITSFVAKSSNLGLK